MQRFWMLLVPWTMVEVHSSVELTCGFSSAFITIIVIIITIITMQSQNTYLLEQAFHCRRKKRLQTQTVEI